jgi:O-acetyl-ADP-ribose deacetylase (regulator of RNase III)
MRRLHLWRQWNQQWRNMQIINGDLLAIQSGILLHQVNCIGATGGLAGALHRKFPYAFPKYFDECALAKNQGRSRGLLGTFIVQAAEMDLRKSLFICHVFGQHLPGPNTECRHVERALESFALERECEHRWSKAQCYAPYQMGCGLGGGNWDDYSALLEKHIPDIIIVRKY